MAAVRVIQEIQISSSPSLPAQPPQPLSFLDAMWLQSSTPVERLFFYDFPHPLFHFIDHNLPILTNSLSLTLRHFYPLAGSIRPSPNYDNQFEITCEEDDSVTITIVEFIGDEFRNISGHHSKNFKNLRLLVPKLTKTSLGGGQFPLISIQITIFPNQGLCIGFAIHHAACDGSGLMQFIRSWAAACRCTEPTLDDISPPFLDRSVIINTHGICRKIFEMMRKYKGASGKCLEKQSSLSISDSNLVFATFTLNKDQIGLLKERVQAKRVEEGKPSLHISAFAVTCAYAWRCLVKAQASDGDIKQYFVCAVDWRARMRPSIPSNYFGNCLGVCMAEVNSRVLVEKNGNEVAAMEISKSIDALQGKDVYEALIAVIDRHWEPARSRRLSVAGSPKFRVYEVDFGWGRPVKVDITSIGGTRAISLVENREEAGGMEIVLVELCSNAIQTFGV
ncbi:Phenolic glucoside malonyltransferase 2 [Dendrobium catenatum]|uniref:Phenolic glucoside malonyltransferase 2 n=1 Tax=Dendrobium catenatum TaxID=906689 RepID=A0A2I0WH15_9ASPA|nr:Phenolic glucoside malonyltransferase 2 [Dendrobium catenatum]